MTPETYPRPWFYALGFLLGSSFWIAFVEIVMQPKSLSVPGTSLSQRLLWWLLVPLVVLGGIYIVHFAVLQVRVHKAEEARQAQQRAEEELKQAEAAALKAAQDRAHYTLEIYGLGLSLEKFRDEQVWAKIQELSVSACILPEIPKTDPDYNDDRFRINEKRGSDALVKALGNFVEEWEIPFIGVMAFNHNETMQEIKDLIKGTIESNRIHVSPYMRIGTVEQVYDDTPDRVLARVFDLFDTNPEMPALALFVDDGLVDRTRLGIYNEDTPPIRGARKPGEMTESMVCLLFARRDRVEILRSSATDQKIQDGLPDYVEGSADNATTGDSMRPFWEKTGPTAAFKPNTWVRRPWCKEQLAQFDMLKLLGRVHRPQIVSYGKPTTLKAQQKAFAEAWMAALESLPEGQKPVRVIFDHGKSPEGQRIVPLSLALREHGPDLDLFGKDGVNLTARVGDTGASSAFVALALGIEASRKDGGPTACVNLRRPDGASIVMIVPPTPEDLVERKINLDSKYLGTSAE